MENPYSSPGTMSTASSASSTTKTGILRFMVPYWSMFGLSVILWFLSAEVRRYDLLELPMVTFMFPLAMFFDPGDAMVGQTLSIILGLCFWASVIPVAFRITQNPRRRLITALGIVGVTGIASLIFALGVAILF